MTTQNSTKQITAKLVKSNASENLVWEISITNSRCKKHYCKTARKTLSYVFFLKKEKNVTIEYDTLRYLKNIIAKQNRSTTCTESLPTEAQ